MGTETGRLSRAGLLVAPLLLAACAGPRPAPPAAAAVSAPESWREPAAAGADVTAEWWTAFGDPALDALVQKALARNIDLSVAAARVAEARAQFQGAAGAQLPQVELVGGGGPQRAVNAFGVGTNQTAGQAQAQIAWDTDLFGRLSNATAAARAQLLATQAAQDGVRLSVVSAVASGYFGLRALDARLAVLEDTATARREALRLATRRASTGYSPLLEQRQAEAELEAAEALIPTTRLAIKRQEDGLSLLLGDLPGAIPRGQALAELRPATAAPGQPAALLRRRPDIAQAEQALVAADRSLDSARAAFMPSVRLTAAGGFVDSTLLPDPVSIFSLGGSILAPIFEGGRLRAQADQAAARRDQAAFLYRRQALVAFREVEDSLAAISRTDEQIAKLSAQRDSLAEVLRMASNRYRAGYSPYLEQLDAQRALLAAELGLVQARSDALTARVQLFQALGGGWAEGREQGPG